MLDAFIEYFKDQCIYEPNGGVPVRRRVSVTRTLTGDGDQCFQKHSYWPFSSLDSCSSLDFIFCMGQFFMEEVVGEKSSGGSQAICLRRNIRARKDQKAKVKDALESSINSLGDEEAANIK
jgi:hypothetical protein